MTGGELLHMLRTSERLPALWIVVAPLSILALAFVYGVMYAESTILGAFVSLPVGTSILLVGLLLLALYLISHNERLWVVLSLMALAALVVRGDSIELGIQEVAYAVFGTLGLAAWFVKETLLLRRQIVFSRFDLFLLTGVVCAILISIPASIIHHSEPKFLVRELLSFSSFLFYFPYRKFIRNDRDIVFLAFVVLLVALLNGAVNAISYQEKVIESAMTFGAVNARSASLETLSMALCGIGFAVVAFARSIRGYLLGTVLLASGMGFIVMSLSRGPILAVAIGMLFGMFLLPARRALQLLLFVAVAVSINLVAVFIFLPDFAASIFDNVIDRVETLERLQSDKSLNSRFSEYETLLTRHVPSSPVVGHGFGTPFSFYDKAFSHTIEAIFMHNGFIYPLYKFGVVVGVFFIAVLFSPFARLFVTNRKSLGQRKHMFLAGSMVTLTALLVSNLTSMNILYYVDVVLYVLAFATIDYVCDPDARRRRSEHSRTAPVIVGT